MNARVASATQELLEQNEELRRYNTTMKAYLANVIDSGLQDRATIEKLETRLREQSDLIQELTQHMDNVNAGPRSGAGVNDAPGAVEEDATERKVEMYHLASGDEPPSNPWVAQAMRECLHQYALYPKWLMP